MASFKVLVPPRFPETSRRKSPLPRTFFLFTPLGTPALNLEKISVEIHWKAVTAPSETVPLNIYFADNSHPSVSPATPFYIPSKKEISLSSLGRKHPPTTII